LLKVFGSVVIAAIRRVAEFGQNGLVPAIRRVVHEGSQWTESVKEYWRFRAGDGCLLHFAPVTAPRDKTTVGSRSLNSALRLVDRFDLLMPSRQSFLTIFASWSMALPQPCNQYLWRYTACSMQLDYGEPR